MYQVCNPCAIFLRNYKHILLKSVYRYEKVLQENWSLSSELYLKKKHLKKELVDKTHKKRYAAFEFFHKNQLYDERQNTKEITMTKTGITILSICTVLFIIALSTGCNDDCDSVLIFEQSSLPGSSIPDDDTNGVQDTIVADVTNTVNSVSVDFVSSHTRWGDLKITLESPTGSKTTLKACDSSGTLVSQTYSTDAFFWTNASGAWVIKVTDEVPGEIGDLTEWTLRIYSCK